jgi:hypothetical protein
MEHSSIAHVCVQRRRRLPMPRRARKHTSGIVSTQNPLGREVFALDVLFQIGAKRHFIGYSSHRPNSDLASAKRAMANSRSRRECAAEIWVRMRALPCGTTGYENGMT